MSILSTLFQIRTYLKNLRLQAKGCTNLKTVFHFFHAQKHTVQERVLNRFVFKKNWILITNNVTVHNPNMCLSSLSQPPLPSSLLPHIEQTLEIKFVPLKCSVAPTTAWLRLSKEGIPKIIKPKIVTFPVQNINLNVNKIGRL